jgi:SAM-dependent methyltransferase
MLEQTMSALNMLPAELYRRCHLKPTDKVSAHPYPVEVIQLINDVRRIGGKVLDCGAGFRSGSDETVVNVEIVDYPSTDVLAVGQSLPFADASFDLVLSLAVLEHVDDPFTCAAELLRVVKPGGKIFCVVPFLQHEHGYPNHFYNMTRQGLRKLFEGKARLLSHEVPTYGAPIYTLCAFVQEYAAGLPAPARAEFEKLTMADVLRLRKNEYWDRSYVRELSAEGNWLLASVTAALFERDAS